MELSQSAFLFLLYRLTVLPYVCPSLCAIFGDTEHMSVATTLQNNAKIYGDDLGSFYCNTDLNYRSLEARHRKINKCTTKAFHRSLILSMSAV
jgi:hypothetical protein